MSPNKSHWWPPLSSPMHSLLTVLEFYTSLLHAIDHFILLETPVSWFLYHRCLPPSPWLLLARFHLLTRLLCLWWPLYVDTLWGALILANSVSDLPGSLCSFNIVSATCSCFSLQRAAPGCWGSLCPSALRHGSAWEVTSLKAATSQCRQVQEYKHSISLSPN